MTARDGERDCEVKELSKKAKRLVDTDNSVVIAGAVRGLKGNGKKYNNDEKII